MIDLGQEHYPSPSANPKYDSFSRFRVAFPLTLFDNKQLADNQSVTWDDQQVSGSGTSSTYTQSKCASTIAVSNTTAGRRVRQTFEKFAYQPGKSQLIMMTAVLGNTSNGLVKRLGYYDDNNGIFFQSVDGVLSVGIRNSGVDTVVPQPNWNQDRMDGTGVSGLALDITLAQIFMFDFEWLGVGSVRFSLIMNGQIFVFHRQDCANNLPGVYTANPNLPLRLEIQNIGTGAASSMDCICGSVMSEGGNQFSGIQRCADTGSTTLAMGNNANHSPLIAIRLKSGYVSNTAIAVMGFNIACDANVVYRYCLLSNPTIVGGSFSFTSAGTNSAVEYATPTSAITISNEGTKFQSGYVSQPANGAQTSVTVARPAIRMGATIAGVADIVVVSVQRVGTSNSANYFGSIFWEEQT